MGRTWALNDSFDFYHKVSLIALYLNERPLFHTPEGIITPYSLEQAMLKRASAKPKFFHFSRIPDPIRQKNVRSNFKNGKFFKADPIRSSSSSSIQPTKEENTKQEISSWRPSLHSRKAPKETSKFTQRCIRKNQRDFKFRQRLHSGDDRWWNTE